MLLYVCGLCLFLCAWKGQVWGVWFVKVNVWVTSIEFFFVFNHLLSILHFAIWQLLCWPFLLSDESDFGIERHCCGISISLSMICCLFWSICSNCNVVQLSLKRLIHAQVTQTQTLKLILVCPQNQCSTILLHVDVLFFSDTRDNFYMNVWYMQNLYHFMLDRGLGSPVVRPPAARAKGPVFDSARPEINFSGLYIWRGWFTGIELVLGPTTWVHFLPVPLDSIV